MQEVPRAGRLSSRGLLLAVLTAAVALAVPRQATAGQYTIFACQADGAGYASSAFQDFATRGMRWRRACNPLGRGLRGLITANVARAGRVARGAQSGFVLAAPPGTAFARLRWSGHARRRDCRYALQLYAERPGGPVAIRNVRANRRCPRRDRAQASGWPRPRAYDLGSATRIVQRVVCVGAPSRRFCSARGQNYIRTFSAEVRVIDGLGPSAAIVTDSPLARSEWVGGIQSFGYDAADNAGVRSAVVLLGGLRPGTDWRACSYALRVPCPNGRGQIEVETGRVPEGSQPMAVLVEDAAGNAAASAPVTVRIDNAAPGAVPVSLAGGESWRNRNNDFDAVWTNPPEGDRAPISAAHYRICRAGTKECVGGERAGAGIARIDNLTVPSPGEWVLRLWRGDAAGNQQPANASLPVKLRYDPEPPELGFEQPSAEDPTRVSALVTDRVSGLAGGSIEIGRVDSGVWQVLGSAREGSRLTARIDDAALPAGEYALRATAYDQASNQASSDRRLDGQPMRVRLPLRVATSMRAGVIRKRKVRRTVRRGGKPRKVRRTVLKRAKVAFGRRVRLGGRLTNGAGKPLAGARVNVYSTPRGGAERLAGTATTNARGRYAFGVRARSSQTLRFAYPGTAMILPAQDTAALLVKGRSSLKADRRRVLNGQRVTFSGRVRGRPLPPAGKLIEMQVRLSRDWQTFRTARSGPKGRWKIAYRFQRTCGVQRFRFRARLPGEASWPLEAGGSRGLTVRVRGRPCSTG